MLRREFLSKAAGFSLLATLPACSSLGRQEADKLAYVSAAKIHTAQAGTAYAVVGLNANQQIRWQTLLPERAHAASISPDTSKIIVTGRRPSTQAWLLNADTGNIITIIQAAPNRHFFGHTVFDASGDHLYSTENNTSNFAGVVSVRAVANPAVVIKEFSSYGVGPHELHFMPNGSMENVLVVANGGIKTAAGSREKLNLASMQPNLAYINVRTGKLLQKVQPPHHQISIRHIDVSDNGVVAVAAQYQGEKSDNVPLLFTHRLGKPALQTMSMPNDDWLFFNQYIGSIAISPDGKHLCATSPRGNCAVLVDVAKNRCIQKIALNDCCGVAVCHDISTVKNQNKETAISLFLVSDGVGQTSQIKTSNNHANITNHQAYAHIHWDNHLLGVT